MADKTAGTRCRGPRLGLLADAYDYEFQERILAAAERAAREHGLDFVAVSGGILGVNLRDPKRFVYDYIGPDSVDALLVCTHVIGHHSTLAELTEFVARFRSVPCVCLGVALPGVSTMFMDNEAGMYTVVRHLVEEHRFRRIAFIAGPAGSEEAQARFRGYARALAERKLEVDPRYVVVGNFTRESGTHAAVTLFNQRGLAPSDIDAIVCADDPMALGALDELERRGVKVPGQIALTGFDDVEFARYARVPLTTVRQPIEEQMRHAVALLAAAVHGGEHKAESVTFQTEFVRRRSCGCSMHQREPVPATAAVPESQDLGAALRGRRNGLLADLDRAAHGRLEFVGSGWADRLFDSFLLQFNDPSQASFLDCVEGICYELLLRGGEVGAAQDVLAVFHREVVACAVDAETRDHVEDLMCEALLSASALAAIAQSHQRNALIARTALLAEATAALLAAPDVSTLAETAANHLPGLGIRAGVIALFTTPGKASEELETALIFTETGRQQVPVRYRGKLLAPADFLDGRSVMVLPLGFRGECLGMALLEYGAADAKIYEDLRLVLGAALKGAQLIRAVEEARKEVEALAVTDPLTGLSNRRHLMRRLEGEFARARRHLRSLSLIVMDLDGFKQVNDEHGHDAGDHVLLRVAERLRRSLREFDTVARYGGDEFVVLLPETDRAQARAAADRIRQSVIGEPVDKHGTVGATFGVATFDPANASFDQEELLRRADRALLAGKRAGKGRILHFDDC
ncbi:MAG: GGDEF domain-containing protein [Deltaproteobacteria bacterium]|nr:GGDEF domain-containing protein [Deltaproteobacteria bacterium]